MKYDKIIFKNIGPIENGQIKRHKINVFFGSNNSGKSIASRLIFGVGQVNTTSSNLQKRYAQKFNLPKNKNMLYGYYVLRSAGFDWENFLTHTKKSCNLVVQSRQKSTEFNFKFKKKSRVNNKYIVMQRMFRFTQNSWDSVYIPAGRTATIQFFTNITRLRNRLLRDFLSSYNTDSFIMENTSAKEIKNFSRSSIHLPEHLEHFYDLILEAYDEGINKNDQDLSSNLFSGSIKTSDARGLSRVIYEDPTGFVTEIESAGSGTVSSFPIIVGMHYIKRGGTLIIEEPEVHLEPARQLKLIGELVRVAEDKKIDLIFTTHSDYIVKKLLTLVSKKKIKHTDLGLYYFNRTPTSLTQIKEIPVDNTGEAEQVLFDEAMDTLVEEFSE